MCVAAREGDLTRSLLLSLALHSVRSKLIPLLQWEEGAGEDGTTGTKEQTEGEMGRDLERQFNLQEAPLASLSPPSPSPLQSTLLLPLPSGPHRALPHAISDEKSEHLAFDFL